MRLQPQEEVSTLLGRAEVVVIARRRRRSRIDSLWSATFYTPTVPELRNAHPAHLSKKSHPAWDISGSHGKNSLRLKAAGIAIPSKYGRPLTKVRPLGETTFDCFYQIPSRQRAVTPKDERTALFALMTWCLPVTIVFPLAPGHPSCSPSWHSRLPKLQ